MENKKEGGSIGRLVEMIEDEQVLECFATYVCDGQRTAVYINAETLDYWAIDGDENFIRDTYIQAKLNKKLPLEVPDE